MFKGGGRKAETGGGEVKGPGGTAAPLRTTKQVGDAAEQRALMHLQQHGLHLLQRNYRLAGGPQRRGAEIDLIMRAPDGTVVFVEVRTRQAAAHGGAAASVGWAKQQRIVRAAQHFLLRFDQLPPCRFDVVAVDGGQLHWLPAAFDAGP